MSEILTKEALIAAGFSDRFSFGMRDRVRFHELDAVGHVNNVAYIRWTETLRVNALPLYGISDFAKGDRNFVLRAQSIEYLAPMHLSDEYVVALRCARIGRSSLDMEYEIRSNGVLTARATSQIVMVNEAQTSSVPISDVARAKIKEIDGIE